MTPFEVLAIASVVAAVAFAAITVYVGESTRRLDRLIAQEKATKRAETVAQEAPHAQEQVKKAPIVKVEEGTFEPPRVPDYFVPPSVLKELLVGPLTTKVAVAHAQDIEAALLAGHMPHYVEMLRASHHVTHMVCGEDVPVLAAIHPTAVALPTAFVPKASVDHLGGLRFTQSNQPRKPDTHAAPGFRKSAS